ncbi:MAG TPA: haloalkane dehalogenase [Acidimicrobiales bacterium]|nr:haloalkane dehalogenase [Acidimicrobiales bacterium]
MRFLRTPDAAFDALPDFPFEPRYAQVADGEGGELRVHYLDEGPAGASTVVLMHGEPSWSFLYRKMIPVLTGAGLRCIAPDLMGFGRSDKPAAPPDYTYARHVGWMASLLLDRIGVSDATLVGQDWGGLIGLRIVAERPDRFARVVVANTGLPTGDTRISDAFLAWQRFSQEAEDFPIGQIVKGGCRTDLPTEVVAAYDAPFPDDSYKAGARVFPTLVPTRPDDPAADANRTAWKALESWRKPFLTAFSDEDPITAGGHSVFQRRVPGARGRQHVTIEGGGHFLQEDRGPELAEVIVDFVRSTTVA